jgi:hypothetical protein
LSLPSGRRTLAQRRKIALATPFKEMTMGKGDNRQKNDKKNKKPKQDKKK